VFCRETVEDVRGASGDPRYPAVLFFFQGSPEEGVAFFDRFWPEARAVSDAERFFYGAFGIGRGRLGQLLGPRAIAAGVRAAFKGNWIGRPVGDPRVMPGLLLAENDHIVWRHDFAHAGDHPDFKALAS
jgi:hypothetical protein